MNHLSLFHPAGLLSPLIGDCCVLIEFHLCSACTLLCAVHLSSAYLSHDCSRGLLSVLWEDRKCMTSCTAAVAALSPHALTDIDGEERCGSLRALRASFPSRAEQRHYKANVKVWNYRKTVFNKRNFNFSQCVILEATIYSQAFMSTATWN